LYDVASALPYEHLDRKVLKLAMSIGGEYRLDWVAGRHWVRLAQELRLDVDTFMARLRGLAERVPDHFAEAGGEDAVRALDTPLPRRLTDAVARRASACVQLLQSAG
jgi:serine/threonine-protein kinase HipA